MIIFYLYIIYLYHGKYDFVWFRRFAKITNNIKQNAIVSEKNKLKFVLSDLSKHSFNNKFESNLIII